MKIKTFMTAQVTDDDNIKVYITGPANKLLVLLEEEAVQIFKELKDEGYPDTLEVACIFFKNVAERVFNDDL